MATCRRIKLDYFFTPYTKINSKCTKELNIIPRTIKLLENKGRILTSVLVIFLGSGSSDTGNKSKNKWDHKLKSFCAVKETIKKTKWQPTEWEMVFANDIANK